MQEKYKRNKRKNYYKNISLIKTMALKVGFGHEICFFHNPAYHHQIFIYTEIQTEMISKLKFQTLR